jgi:ribonuclease HII
MTLTKLKQNTIFKADCDHFAALVQHDNDLFGSIITEPQSSLLIGFDEVGRGCLAGPVCTAAYSSQVFYHNSEDLLRSLRLTQELESHNEHSEDERKLSMDNFWTSLLLLDDSKQVPHSSRQLLCDALFDVPSDNIFYSTNFQSAQKIDSDGIVACIYRSMAINLLEIVLQYLNTYNRAPREILLLIDGNKSIANLLSLLDEELNKQNISDINFVQFNPSQRRLFEDAGIILYQHNIIRGDALSASIAAASNIAKLARDNHMKELSRQNDNIYHWSANVGYGTRRHIEAIKTYGLSSEHRKTFCKAGFS